MLPVLPPSQASQLPLLTAFHLKECDQMWEILWSMAISSTRFRLIFALPFQQSEDYPGELASQHD